MGTIKTLVVVCSLCGFAGYVWQERYGRHVRAEQAMQEQEIRLASLQVELARQHANREAYVVRERARLQSMESQLADAKRVLAGLMDQWTDARDHVLANGRMPDPNEELKSEQGRVASMRRELDQIQQRLGKIEGDRKKQLVGLDEQKRAAEAEYAWQLETLKQETDQWQALQAQYAAAKGVSPADRKLVDEQLGALGMNQSALEQQQLMIAQSQAAFERQVNASFAAQRSDLNQQKERLQAQIGASLGRADELRVEIAVHNKRVDADKVTARILQDKVKAQEDLVAQLSSDVATVLQRVRSASGSP